MTNSIPTNKFVTDTMGLILQMEHRRLSRQVKEIFDKGMGTVRKNAKVVTKTSSFNAFKGVFTFLRTVPMTSRHH
jgi:hypothetical protein